uniref:Tumor necrosis factor receptor superfamily, member 9a n=1 Tax=Salarias fasciatus TaxID=181472 RepID=A0A672JCK3_SALFA
IIIKFHVTNSNFYIISYFLNEKKKKKYSFIPELDTSLSSCVYIYFFVFLNYCVYFVGHRLVRKCGPAVIDLCTPCEPGTYTSNFSDDQCKWCTQCAGAQVQLEACTPTADTKCGCKEGLTCGNDHCSVCVPTCTKGQEPHDGSCRPCSNGTFNDKIHQKCKPWSTECPKPNQRIAAKGDAFTDIKCVNISNLISVVTKTVTTTETPVSDPKTVVKVEPPGEDIKVFCLCLYDPQTLIAIECSFHEAEQEQGSSSESLFSKDSSEQLIT